MLIDIIIAWICGAMLDPFLGGQGYGYWAIIVLLILFFVNWIRGVVRLSKNENKAGMWTTLGIGLGLSFFLGWMTSLFFSSEPKNEKTFYCNLCHITYNNDLLGGKTDRWGQICRYCIEKQHKENNN